MREWKSEYCEKCAKNSKAGGGLQETGWVGATAYDDSTQS